mgnify:FL=1
MIVTVMRHGEAGSAPRDRDRTLTVRGISEVGEAAATLRSLCDRRRLPRPDRVLHSPWVRTTATATLLAEALSPQTLQVAGELAPGAAVDGVDQLLAGVSDTAHLVIVSHQPLVSLLIDRYSGEPRRVPGLYPAGFAVLAMDAPGAGCGEVLGWALPPVFKVAR